MKKILGFMRSTVVGGFVFLIPVVVPAVVLGKAFSISRGLVRPLVPHLPIQSAGGYGMDGLLAVSCLVILCFAAGLLARSSLGRSAVSVKCIRRLGAGSKDLLRTYPEALQ